jgi:hypothetical protein
MVRVKLFCQLALSIRVSGSLSRPFSFLSYVCLDKLEVHILEFFLGSSCCLSQSGLLLIALYIVRVYVPVQMRNRHTLVLFIISQPFICYFFINVWHTSEESGGKYSYP